jgi:hypothetical protein
MLQLLRGLLRGAAAGIDGAAVGDEPHWPNERHTRCRAGDAQAALGAHLSKETDSIEAAPSSVL